MSDEIAIFDDFSQIFVRKSRFLAFSKIGLEMFGKVLAIDFSFEWSTFGCVSNLNR